MNLKINKLRTLAKRLESNACHAILFFVTVSGMNVISTLFLLFSIFLRSRGAKFLPQAFNSSGKDSVIGGCKVASCNVKPSGEIKANTAQDTSSPAIKRPRGADNLSDEIIYY